MCASFLFLVSLPTTEVMLFGGVRRIKGIHVSLFCVLRRNHLSCEVPQETFVQEKLLFCVCVCDF